MVNEYRIARDIKNQNNVFKLKWNAGIWRWPKTNITAPSLYAKVYKYIITKHLICFRKFTKCSPCTKNVRQAQKTAYIYKEFQDFRISDVKRILYIPIYMLTTRLNTPNFYTIVLRVCFRRELRLPDRGFCSSQLSERVYTTSKLIPYNILKCTMPHRWCKMRMKSI